MANNFTSGISRLGGSDDHGCCIPSRYCTYGFADEADRERLQIGNARATMVYALANIAGSGAFEITVWPESFPTLLKQNPWPFQQPEFDLADLALDDTNIPLNVPANRAFVQIDSSGIACASWLLKRINMGLITDRRITVTGK